jgi:hypothetical protein
MRARAAAAREQFSTWLAAGANLRARSESPAQSRLDCTAHFVRVSCRSRLEPDSSPSRAVRRPSMRAHAAPHPPVDPPAPMHGTTPSRPRTTGAPSMHDPQPASPALLCSQATRAPEPHPCTRAWRKAGSIAVRGVEVDAPRPAAARVALHVPVAGRENPRASPQGKAGVGHRVRARVLQVLRRFVWASDEVALPSRCIARSAGWCVSEQWSDIRCLAGQRNLCEDGEEHRPARSPKPTVRRLDAWPR